MSKQNVTPPHVSAEVVQGRLVRVCPKCKEQIVEHTDDDGMVSNHFAEHWETEHPIAIEPEQLEYYVLQSEMKFGPEASRNLAHQALRLMREHSCTAPDGKPINWTLVDRVEDLPEGAPTVEAAAVLHRLFDKDGGGIPLCQRQGNDLVAIPSEETEEERERRQSEHKQNHDVLMKRWIAARHILIDRREHRLPKLRILKRDRGIPAAMEKYEAWRERREPLEAKITKDIDEAEKRSSKRLSNGRDDWHEPLDEAILAAKITEEEIAAECQWMEEREAEVERRITERT